MEKKSGSILIVLYKIVLVVICVVAFAMLGFVVAGKFLQFDYLPYVYALGAEIILPIEQLFFGDVTTVSVDLISTIVLAVSAVLIVITLFELIGISRSFKDDEYTASGALFFFVILFNLAIVALYGYGLVVSRLNYSIYTNFLNQNSLGIIDSITQDSGRSIILIKGIVLSGLAFVISLFNIATFFAINPKLSFEKKGSKKIRTTTSLYFYSSEYKEPEEQPKVRAGGTNNEVEIVENIKESDEQAKELVKKVMQLNELKEQGQITEREYTRLRQKAIRRYKG